MAAALNGQLAQLTSAQLAALPPHEKLKYSARLPIEALLRSVPISPAALRQLAMGGNNHHLVGRTPPPILPKRPLNSWMAFRSFYSRIFAPLQQKDTSGYLTLMWQRDPFKAKWTIVARAYSTIRDHIGKSNASLERFLNLVCPEIGIISVEDYLGTMNWEIEITIDGSMSLKQTSMPNFVSFSLHIINTSMTEKDVIHFCGQRGYISIMVAIFLTGQDPPSARGLGAFAAHAAQLAQQGLLASTPLVFVPQSTPSVSAFLQTVTSDPRSAASLVLGFDVNQMLEISALEDNNSNNQQMSTGAANHMQYQWTGSMSDLYDPSAGSFDFEHLTGHSSSDLWNVGDLHDPLVLENMLEVGVVRDGHLIPTVPDDETEDYLA